jgi:replicative DNA helicase
MAADRDPESFSGRVPPNSLQAEQSALGCALSGERYLSELSAMLRAEDFYRPEHRLLFEAMLELFVNSQPVDIITVSELLERKGVLAKAGGIEYVSALPDMAPVLANAGHYGEIVRQKSILRRLISSLEDVKGMAYAEAEDANQLLDLAARRIYEIRENRDAVGFESLREIMARVVNEISALARGQGKDRRIPTGFPSLDRTIGGLSKGSLVIIAARPSMGKTALAMNIAQKVSTLHGLPVAFFSLEMSKEEVANRLLSTQAMINNRSLQSGEIRDDDWDRIAKALPPLYAAPMHIDDRSGSTVVEMLAKCRQLRLESRLGLVVIDYMQLMAGSSEGGKSENRQQEISEISRTMKIMARELNVPIIALSQLSRACEMRANKRPMLSDLRDSGAIEQDADVVMFLYRNHYYDENKLQLETEEAEVIVAKNRQGGTGTVKLGWYPKYTMFFEQESPSGDAAGA